VKVSFADENGAGFLKLGPRWASFCGMKFFKIFEPAVVRMSLV